MRIAPSPRVHRSLAALAVSSLVLAVSACGDSAGDSANAAPGGGAPEELRLGYFANVTHAAALIGVQEGYITDELGTDTTLATQVFNAGPDEVEALFAGALDAAYIGPSPTINAYGQSGGDAIRIIAGAASGGAQLIVRDGIDSADALAGTNLASPQLGNTQDVALRTWLTEQGLKNSVAGGGDVTIAPTPNSDIPNLFQAGELDGAWVPEPTASLLVLERGGKVLVNEKDLWPDGAFVTTHLVVRTEFLEQYPDAVEALLRAHVRSVEFAEKDAAGAKASVNAGLDGAGGKSLAPEVLDRAWSELTVTADPIASALKQSAENGFAAGTTAEQVDLDGIYDLRLLNGILADESRDGVSAGGLGAE